MTRLQPKSRLHRFAPIWHLALRSNRLLRRERKEHRETRHLLAVSRSQQATSAAELIDANAQVRRLNQTLDFLVDCRAKAMESEL